MVKMMKVVIGTKGEGCDSDDSDDDDIGDD